MMIKKWLLGCLAFFVLLAHGAVWASTTGENAEFICGGKLEAEVWRLWDSSAREYIRKQQFTARLRVQGDTYALYDIQTYTHNLVAMAQRCNRVERLEELADLFAEAFLFLEATPDGNFGLAWVCKGGAVCNDKNRLVNREVMLNSIQYLALAVSVANSLARKSRRHEFVSQTAVIASQHLLRFSDKKAILLLGRQLAAQAQDVNEGNPQLLFVDKHLWMIAIYADLAGILESSPSIQAETKLMEEQLQAMHQHLSRLLKLFKSRVTLTEGAGREGRQVKMAEIDRGYWSLHVDNHYAGYTGSEKPVTCIKQPDGSFHQVVLMDAGKIAPVGDLGWDISHARRLVHAFNAIERNRSSIQKFYGITAADIPATEVVSAFARQLVEKIWNGDKDFPLFSNYWGGANGWFRVGYENGVQCLEGYPPFGLSDSFISGGYASWVSYTPEIRPLGRTLYRLYASDNTQHRQFMGKYYPVLVTTDQRVRMLYQLMFWPSLVENGK